MELRYSCPGELTGIPKLLPTTLFTILGPQRLVIVLNCPVESPPLIVWIKMRTRKRLQLRVQAFGTDKLRNRARSHPTPTVKSSSVSAARALNCTQLLKQTLRS